jgi:hypothetical protein
MAKKAKNSICAYCALSSCIRDGNPGLTQQFDRFASHTRWPHPEHDQSPFFLQKAQNALQEALISLDPLSFQRKPTLLADLAVVSIYRQDIEEACTLISQAATLATQMHLHKVTQRLFALREPLSPWKELASVKTLDAHLAFLSSQGNKQR